MSVLYPFNPESEVIGEFPPDKEVVVPVLIDLYAGDIMCDHAYSTESETKAHFWWKNYSKHTRNVHMTVREFLSKVPQGMNPFETFNQLQFLQRWAAYHYKEGHNEKSKLA